MSYRFNSIDIVVGVGLCAVLFGAMIFAVATSGAFIVSGPQATVLDQALPSTASAWLQPALGQAIVDRAVLQQRTDRITASAAAEWNQAMAAYRSLRATPGGPFAFIIDRAVTMPDEHAARIQTVMGRAIVNFTQRGIRSGVLSADLYLSDYNQDMIAAADVRARRMHDEFATTWQAMLGRWIVDSSREQLRRTADVQQQLGTAIVHTAQARTSLEAAWAANQYQVGTLLAAVDRVAPTEAGELTVASAETSSSQIASFTRPSFIPDVPVAYLFASALLLCGIFLGGLMLSAASREAKALADAKRNAGRWVYRMAS